MTQCEKNMKSNLATKKKCEVAELTDGTKVGLFDLISDLSYNKTDLLHDKRSGMVKTNVLRVYVPYMVNRAFSLDLSSILDAQLMNESYFINSDIQHDFYLHGLRKAKRFNKWPKTVVEDEIKMICEEYQVNIKHAREIARTLTKEQKNIILTKQENKGGSDGRKQRSV